MDPKKEFPAQSVMAPNGILAHLFGPVQGRESNLLPQLVRMVKPNGEPYVVYGDTLHMASQDIISSFTGASVTWTV